MKKTSVIPLMFIIFGVVLGESLERIGSLQGKQSVDFLKRERGHEERMHEASVQALNPSKSTVNLAHGNNPVIERQGNLNVKTTRRRITTPQNSPGREPSIQAYGLPKRIIENNGYIERVNLDRVSGLDGKVDKIDFRGSEPGIHAYGLAKEISENNGVIERIRNNEDKFSSVSNDFATVRRIRSIDGYTKNDLVDLEAQEAKVFRPLFVYRQQVADRYRVKEKKNPIYGAYQYGSKKQRKFIQAPSKYHY